MRQAFALRGVVGLVTGAGSGIGAALARALAARGTALALVDRDADGLAATLRAVADLGGSASGHVLDLADPGAIEALPAEIEARFGRLDLLVNNAGVALGGRFEDTDLADFEWLMDVNFRAVVRMTHAFLPLLTRAPMAQIVNVSSLYGLIAPPGQTAYAASKFAVRGFSEALRHEYAGTALGVTLVHPGGVATGIARNARHPRGLDPASAEEARIAFERFLRLSPDAAAAEILRGIERRAPRVMVGRDARQVAFLQRLMPVGYWAPLARLTGQRRSGPR
ncbi:SDR family NAD(P)-dependent oxidoreductase [Methylobacterium planeticum]|uniref:SDR family NAD(P)-dependent oxidoreductase n=1 Tax=Methylobacterium planeticum TaxID=2615211 RepID=A0A6N6MK65_9HYPH|nr:SDR family NAD(P)-dependent oxidoreductase [Methylobacterium planeticum]KAB1070957.1 SDR family NAD(P)-dependent oxidoreductase [Methylobacterium planeticum]